MFIIAHNMSCVAHNEQQTDHNALCSSLPHAIRHTLILGNIDCSCQCAVDAHLKSYLALGKKKKKHFQNCDFQLSVPIYPLYHSLIICYIMLLLHYFYNVLSVNKYFPCNICCSAAKDNTQTMHKQTKRTSSPACQHMRSMRKKCCKVRKYNQIQKRCKEHKLSGGHYIVGHMC